jgi:hypothetical protein
MKEIDGLNERMDGNDEIVDSLIKKIDDLEKRYVKNTDYTLHFEALKKIFEVFLIRYNKESIALFEAVSRLNIEYPADQIQKNLAELKTILKAIQRELPIKVKHQLDIKTKAFVISIIVIASSCLLNGYLWTENTRLQAVDIKYRLLNQLGSNDVKIADSVYSSDPDETAKMVDKSKTHQVELSKKKQKAVGGKGLTKRRTK